MTSFYVSVFYVVTSIVYFEYCIDFVALHLTVMLGIILHGSVFCQQVY